MPGVKSTAPVKAGTKPSEVSAAEDVSSFLEQVKRMPPVERRAGERGRLIFAMDATMSRQPTWDRALQIQSEMFIETEKIGGLDVQLVYFRGFNECRASKWVSEPSSLANMMTGVDCRGGNTQIGKVLSHVRRAASEGKISAVVYVGDAMEENVDSLCQTAGEIGLLNVPIFMFQEGNDGVTRHAFQEIAKLTHGAYFRLDASSARQLRELLAAVAVYAAGGREALADHSREKGGTARLLLEQLR
ncbi:VWA domain-containing protein [Taklimakanibacter lacteus]|uniref:VWA domain-containing protein n=1 Tax=Taklimakanibacter lacteus TaxID=2268456 RepID=UPI000E667D26